MSKFADFWHFLFFKEIVLTELQFQSLNNPILLNWNTKLFAFVILQKANLAIAELTITYEREQAVDFKFTALFIKSLAHSLRMLMLIS